MPQTSSQYPEQQPDSRSGTTSRPPFSLLAGTAR
ncbi:hypothetical protein FOXYSP1_05252 [Fusarium oxysporum f. sp. phaseoli]